MSAQTPTAPGGEPLAPPSETAADSKTNQEPAATSEEKPDEQANRDVDEEPKLPPLVPAEFRVYNEMAEHMDYFHNHFRQIWTMMYNACKTKKRPAGMSIRQFLDQGLQFIRMLTMHHSIEEASIFPMLAKRMPEFQAPDKKKGRQEGNSQMKGRVKAAQLVEQHRAIHVGMDAFEDYLRRCRDGEVDLDLAALKAQMDSWGTVLWQHLDDEVATLGAENMRKYWSLDEMRRMRIM